MFNANSRYGNPDFDAKRYYHWNHPRLAHWNREKASHYPQHSHTPPDDIGSNFYPLLGAYSSRSPAIIDKHMRMIRMSGAGMRNAASLKTSHTLALGTLSVSWYPPGMSDDQGHSWDDLMPRILDAAEKYKLKVMETKENKLAMFPR